ncbi:MAG TPA: glycosyltransferase family 4 protein [Solirubrobacteraceae bacterium]
MAIALLTTYLAGYRMPLYERLAERHGVEVLCYGRGERYVPEWFRNLDTQLEAAPFPARRLHGAREAFEVASRYDAVIAPFAGGAILPAAYVGARRHKKPFILWASVWAQPRSITHALALPLTRHIYRRADAVVAYGEHVRRFVAGIRGRDDDVFVAPQSVEPELFARDVPADEVQAFRAAHGLGEGHLAIYVGRLVPEKGVEVLLDTWPSVHARCGATLVLVGDGPLAGKAGRTDAAKLIGPLPRPELPAAFAAADVALLPSIPTPRFLEPWGLVCNEAMDQGKPVIATTAVGAVAGGLVVDGETGLVVPPRDPEALMRAIDRLLSDDALRARLGAAAKQAVRPYSYEAMVEAFDRALATAMRPSPTGP